MFSEPIAYVTLVVIAITCVISFYGFKSRELVERWIFSPEEILAGKEYYRVFSSAFLHSNVMHLVCNMITLYFFGGAIELLFGPAQFLIIYFGAILGGSALSLWLHRNHVYRSYGASDGVCGVMFAHIFLFPGQDIHMFFVPIGIPTWLYAMLFMGGSFYALRRGQDNVAHDAHLGGAIAGLAITTALHHEIIRQSPVMFAVISIASVAILAYLVRNPLWLPSAPPPTVPRKPILRKRKQQPQPKKFNVDALLDKISEQGMDSLTPEEKAYLESVSEKYRRRAEVKAPESELYF